MVLKELVLVLSLSVNTAVNMNSTESLRLVGGARRCEGTVEVMFRGEWRRALTFDLWDLETADAVCLSLDCGSAVSTEKRRGLNISDVWWLMSDCVKSSSVTDCVSSGSSGRDDALQVVCSDSVRLVSGRNLCSGSLQIRDQSLDQSWSWVCEGALDRAGAEVLCRELGCGPPLLQGALSPLEQTFHCEGHESALMDCPRDQTKKNPGTCSRLSLTCSEPVRLVGGASRCEGTVEVKFRGEWRRALTLSRWDLVAAGAVCRSLDCGSAISSENRRGLNVTDVWWVNPDCMKTTFVRNCVYYGGSGLDGGLQVVCSDSVRLVSGRSLCSGSLQVRDQSLDQSWSWVCEGALDRAGAEVLCRELGCGPPLLQGELSPLGQTFHCEGHESALMDCPREQTKTNPETCSRLSLTCSEPVRLVGGASRCEGTVEVKYRGEWRRALVFNFYDPWDLVAAASVCRELDCGSAVSTERKYSSYTGDVWSVRSDCVKRSPLRECVYGGEPGRGVGLKVWCSDSVRLVSGQNLCSGSLQVRDRSLDQSWSWVCEGALDRVGAEVLCRELGCGPPLLQGALSPLGQTFHCEGPESGLMDCSRDQTKTNPETCSRLQLTCSEPVRLVGGASRCEGTVEVKYRGEWRRIWLFAPWTLHSAAVVCRSLDCGSPVSVETRHKFKRKDVWKVKTNCAEKFSVRDCIIYEEPACDEGVKMVCSDSVRLVSGRSLCSGSLQVRDRSLGQSWTRVCEGALNRAGAEVLCRELDCGPPLLQGALSRLDQTFYCEGPESGLMDCSREQTRTNPETCPALQVTCSEPVRLVGGAGRCEGTVEVKLKGEWKRMNTLGGWNLETASVVCRDLDCGSAGYPELRLSNRSDVWWILSHCARKASVRDCVGGSSSSDQYSRHVLCSGHQGAPEGTERKAPRSRR